MANNTYAMLVSVAGVTGALPIRKGKVRVLNTCPDTVFVASGNNAIIPKEANGPVDAVVGSFPIATGTSEVITLNDGTLSAIVHSLGGIIYITPV